eukprot:5888473-Pyramimonas_sp.AAC.1
MDPPSPSISPVQDPVPKSFGSRFTGLGLNNPHGDLEGPVETLKSFQPGTFHDLVHGKLQDEKGQLVQKRSSMT